MIDSLEMNANDMQELRNLQLMADAGEDIDDDGDWQMMDGILRGETVAAVRDAGGDWRSVMKGIQEDVEASQRCVPKLLSPSPLFTLRAENTRILGHAEIGLSLNSMLSVYSWRK